jgi:hypothetical protein
MLAADKLQLQSQLRQQAVSLKEKEFNLHHSNLMTVGTQAAVLAGLDITMFIEFTPAPVSEWKFAIVPRMLSFVYYTMISAAFCSNMMVVSQTTALSVLGAGLALRGPDGSMMVATDALYGERERVFSIFARGLALTVSSILVGVWLMLNWETALMCWMVALYTCHAIYSNYSRVATILDFDERDTVDFRDIMDGPGNVRLQRRKRNAPSQNNRGNTSSSRRYAVSGESNLDDSEESNLSSGDVEMQAQQKLMARQQHRGSNGSTSSRRRGKESTIQTV